MPWLLQLAAAIQVKAARYTPGLITGQGKKIKTKNRQSTALYWEAPDSLGSVVDNDNLHYVCAQGLHSWTRTPLC